jgi:hypothetical protein
MRFGFVVSLFAIFLAPSSFAWEGKVKFSDREVAEHRAGINTILKTATACLQHDLDRHQEFFKKYGVARFYGDRSAFAKMPATDKLQHIRNTLEKLNYRGEEIPRLSRYIFSQMEPTSCVGLVLKCLGKGFAAAGQEDLWEEVADYARKNGQDGTAIQNALQQLGWRVLYWNPWVEYITRWDEIEHAKDPVNKSRFWGYHAYRYQTVMRSRMYLYNRVDDATTLVNFGRDVPTSFKRVPFFVGTAHTGYHVFPGMYGNVIEGHSTRQITDGQTIESSAFNPLQDGGAPRGNYFSGLVAVPPGY